MQTSIEWLNKYLSPANVTADEADEALTGAGFPIEARDDHQDDVVLDVELTSNRGDCLCHVGLAREVAAKTGRRLVAPAPKASASGPDVKSITSVQNTVGGLCPRFTARVIRNVKVGPSPAWLVKALERIGQRTINNIVDASNFVLHELGHPSHAFDLDTLAEKRLVVRYAKKGERLIALDAKEHKLIESDLVVADANRAVSLAGVIGGLDTGVTNDTKDVLIEVATWEPLTIRATARRLAITTDAGYRFERKVDPRDIQWASDRLCELILDLAGGELCTGMIDELGAATPAPITVNLRPERCNQIVGIDIPTDRMASLLTTVGFKVERQNDALRCTVPHHRPDVTREIDLIEEVARLHGYDAIHVADTVETHLNLKHPAEWARREEATARIGAVLTGQGFYETVTFSFLDKPQAEMFTPKGVRLLKVDEERRKATPYLRPSIIPSLLSCRRANQDARLERAEGIRLFEIASVFGEQDDGKAFARKTIEHRNLEMYADAPVGGGGKLHERLQEAVRRVRGAIEETVSALGGQGNEVSIEPTNENFMPALEGETVGIIRINNKHAGYITTLSKSTISVWGLDQPGAAAVVNLQTLIDLYPPTVTVRELPRFPSIERDLSLVVDESITWKRIADEITELNLNLFDGLRFIGVYRGKQAGAGKKSVTLRIRFRDDERTLRHEEVDAPVDRAVKHLAAALGAELRA